MSEEKAGRRGRRLDGLTPIDGVLLLAGLWWIAYRIREFLLR